MPTYTATADIYNVLSSKIVAELTDDSEGTTVDTDIVDSALDRAESVVDSYVGKAYDVPLDLPVSDAIAHAVLTLAKCYLYGRRPGVSPDEAREDCEKIVAWLEMVASGEIEIDDIDAAADVAEQGADDEVFGDGIGGASTHETFNPFS